VCQSVNAREIKDLRDKSSAVVSVDGTPSLGVIALNHAYARRMAAGFARFYRENRFDCRHRGGQGCVKTAVTPYVGAKKHTRQHGSNSAGNGNSGCQC
jgi:hypothetical protein